MFFCVCIAPMANNCAELLAGTCHRRLNLRLILHHLTLQRCLIL